MGKTNLQTCLKAYFEAQGLKPQALKILVAVSGGPDSMALLHALHAFDLDLAVAHLNYRLRPESDSEAQLVAGFCAKLGIPFFSRELQAGQVKGMPGSVQIVARELRYTFFEELMAQHGLSHCATAHHQSDQVETLLMSLIRGGAPAHIKGIPAQRGKFIRPWLKARRGDIDDYINFHEIPFAIDPSNLSPIYTRNLIRLRLLPLLKELNPSFNETMVNFYEDLELKRELIGFLGESLNGKAILAGERRGEWRFLVREVPRPEHLKIVALDELLEREGFSGTQIREARKMWTALAGKKLVFDNGTILKTPEGFYIRNHPEPRFNHRPSEVTVPEFAPGVIEMEVGTWKITFSPREYKAGEKLHFGASHHFLDPNKLKFPLKIRPWREGDRIQPFGMEGKKKISDVFSDLALNQLQRQRALVFEDCEKIVLLSGYRVAEKVRITDSSRKLWEITLKKIDI